jgi:CspA family cold shock protein
MRLARLTSDIVNVATIAPPRAARRRSSAKGQDDMATGTVKWFNPAKGYGFIEPSDGGKDAFVHISAVERAGLSSLTEGQKVSYELQQGQNGKTSAENLSVLD